MSKIDIVDYAKQHKLHWNEDKTNLDTTILRNYVRLVLLPKIETKNLNFKQEMLTIYQSMISINSDIDLELAQLTDRLRQADYDRQQIIMLPIEVSYSWLHFVLTQKFNVEVDSKTLRLVRNFIHTAKNNKTMHVSKVLDLRVSKNRIVFAEDRN